MQRNGVQVVTRPYKRGLYEVMHVSERNGKAGTSTMGEAKTRLLRVKAVVDGQMSRTTTGAEQLCGKKADWK